MFGRKKQQYPVYVIPREAWDGPGGEALRAAGMSPDDPSNIVYFDNPVDANVAQARTANELDLKQRNDELERTHPGCRLATQFIVTEDVWNGRHSKMLLQELALTPYDSWNVRYHPADEASESALGQPMVFEGQVNEIVEAIDRLIGELAEEHRQSADFAREMIPSLHGLANYMYETHLLPILGQIGEMRRSGGTTT